MKTGAGIVIGLSVALAAGGGYWLGQRPAAGPDASVVAATEVMLGRPCFEVEFSDGEVIVADSLGDGAARASGEKDECRRHKWKYYFFGIDLELLRQR